MFKFKLQIVAEAKIILGQVKYINKFQIQRIIINYIYVNYT